MSSTKSSRDPIISIGLPVYNGAERLGPALDSVLSQDFTDIEVVITDNASTDDTRLVCEDYAKRDRRVRYVRNETNIGVNRNHDLVFTLSRGRYFAWFADDLEYLPGMLSRCHAAMESASSSVALVYPLCDMVFEGESQDGCRHVSVDCRDPRPFKRMEDVVSRVVMVDQLFGLIKRDVLARTHLNGLFPGSDCVLLAELAMLGEIHELPEVLIRRQISASRGTAALKDNEAAWKRWAGADRRGLFDRLPVRERMAVEYVRAAWRSPIALKERLPCVLRVLPVYYARTVPAADAMLRRARSLKRRLGPRRENRQPT